MSSASRGLYVRRRLGLKRGFSLPIFCKRRAVGGCNFGGVGCAGGRVRAVLDDQFHCFYGSLRRGNVRVGRGGIGVCVSTRGTATSNALCLGRRVRRRARAREVALREGRPSRSIKASR